MFFLETTEVAIDVKAGTSSCASAKGGFSVMESEGSPGAAHARADHAPTTRLHAPCTRRARAMHAPRHAAPPLDVTSFSLATRLASRLASRRLL